MKDIETLEFEILNKFGNGLSLKRDPIREVSKLTGRANVNPCSSDTKPIENMQPAEVSAPQPLPSSSITSLSDSYIPQGIISVSALEKTQSSSAQHQLSRDDTNDLNDQDDEPGKKKKKRRKVNHACLYCRRSHMTCDEGRPCQRWCA